MADSKTVSLSVGRLVLVPSQIKNLNTEGVHRVVLCSPLHDIAALYCLGEIDSTTKILKKGSPRKPIVCSLSLLEPLLGNSITNIEEQIPNISDGEKPSADEEAARERRREILTPLIDPDMLFRMLVQGRWKEETDRTAEKFNVSAPTVTRLLGRYFTERMSVEDACRRGYVGAKRGLVASKKRGAPVHEVKAGHNPSAIGRNVGDQDRQNILVHYQSLEDQSIPDAEKYRRYEVVFRPSSLAGQSDGSMIQLPNPLQPFISERQYRYHLKDLIGELNLLVAAAGERKHVLKSRTILGSARDRIPYPGHTYVIDSTVGDVYLVSSFDRTLIIGRPVVYVVIDAFSSLIVGLHVALEGPNLVQARIAMHRAMTDKKRWLSWLGIPGLAPYLPHGCRPTYWLADRAELLSKASGELQIEIGSSLSLAAAYRADWKSIVERSFGILNNLCIHWLAGAVRHRVRERGSRDHRLDATLTLKQFTRILVRQVCSMNLCRSMSQHLSGSMIRDTVTSNPIGFWDWGLRNLHGSAKLMSEQESLSAVIQQNIGTISRQGVTVDQKLYTAKWMEEHAAVGLAGYKGPSRIKTVASPDDPLVQFCFMPDEVTPREATYHSMYQAGEDHTIEDMLEEHKVKAFAGKDLKAETDDIRVTLRRASEDEMSEARVATQVAHKVQRKSKSERLNGIKQNRIAEVNAPPDAAVKDAAHQVPAEAKDNIATESNEFASHLAAAVESWN